MEIGRLLRILGTRWTVIVAFILLGIAGGAAAAVVTPVKYSASTRLFVGVQIAPGSSSSDLVQGNNFAAQKVASYVDVATSPRVLDPVIGILKMKTTAADLAREVTASTQVNSVVIEIAALAETPRSAAVLSRTIAESFANVVVNQIEKPADGSTSPVKVEILQPAVAPKTAAFPILPLNLAIGALSGLIIGFTLALAFGLLDRRLHSRSAVERVAGLPTIGVIGTDRVSRKHPIISSQLLRGIRAEEFRGLRTNLQYLNFAGQLKSFLVTSSVSGEGKTSTVANLATILAESGATVAVVDADLRMPHLAELLNLDASSGLTDVLVGRITVAEALRPWGQRAAVVILPAGNIPPNPSELLGSTAMTAVLAELSQNFDYVLIDAPPVLPVTDAVVLSREADATILVAEVNRVQESQLLAAIEMLRVGGTTPVGMVVTRVPRRGPDSRRYAFSGYYAPSHSESVNTASEISPQHSVASETSSRNSAVGSISVNPKSGGTNPASPE
ncbi:MAG: polysaccharide biosynthesis tyrosine autokinase [Microbacteriaceae bacterium]|nr:polysaccharide biosynthesis tyrosine autokinase [Microbacteriaceae bacterium]